MESINTDFPRGLFKAYAEGRITRNNFEAVFSEWQKRHGINYDCKGDADKNGIYVLYRGVKATIKGDFLVWCNGVKPVGKLLKRPDIQSARSVFEFKRKVDFSILREWLWKGGTRCRELTR